MRLFMMALPFWLWGLAFGAVMAQEEGQTPEPPKVESPKPLLKYVVIYEYPGWNADDPTINLRVMVRARDETSAVHVATGYLFKVFQTQFDRLKFIEAVQKKD